MRKLLPILLALIGVAGGIGAGIFLKSDEMPAELASPCGDVPQMAKPASEPPTDVEYVKLNNQFVVPVVSDAKISAMIVVAISIEVETGRSEDIYSREPKLRDAFLQVFFDHANVGGFGGSFTSSRNLDVLRRALRETAQNLFGDMISDVLITDIARQDV